MLIKVKVFPGSKEEEVIKKSDDSFEVKVKGFQQRNKIFELDKVNRSPVSVRQK